ncbi:MAG: alpha/beta fold hydrolase [Clostridia bacterium]|nr:alpha/beta fold hydrolase [Clostridia bacterium]
MLSLCVISVIASAVVFRVLFPRQTGVSKYHFAYEELSAPPARTGFSFRSGNNELQGWRYDAVAPEGVIVVVNGIGSGADEHLPEILFFLEHGWSVITWDATGVGASEGRGIIGLQQIDSDLKAFMSYFCALDIARDLPVVLYGHSAGAYAAAMSLPGNGIVRAAVLISGFDRPVELLYHHARQRVGFLADIEYPFLRLENFFLFGNGSDASAREALGRAEVPVLVVNGSSDDLVPWQFSLARDPELYTNPNIHCREITSTYQNEHSAPWLSAASAEYVYNNWDNPNVDKALASEVNTEFLQSVLDFYSGAVR